MTIRTDENGRRFWESDGFRCYTLTMTDEERDELLASIAEGPSAMRRVRSYDPDEDEGGGA